MKTKRTASAPAISQGDETCAISWRNRCYENWICPWNKRMLCKRATKLGETNFRFLPHLELWLIPETRG